MINLLPHFLRFVKSFLDICLLIFNLSEIFETEGGRSPTGVLKISREKFLGFMLMLIKKLTLPWLAA